MKDFKIENIHLASENISLYISFFLMVFYFRQEAVQYVEYVLKFKEKTFDHFFPGSLNYFYPTLDLFFLSFSFFVFFL